MLAQLLTLLGVFLLPTPVIAEPTPVVVPQVVQPIVKEYSKEEIKARITHYSVKYGVSSRTMNSIVSCESGYNPKIQSNHRYTYSRPKLGLKAGQREQSYGLVQIHLPVHPNISKEQALDPEFSLDFLASNLAKGKGRMWTCYSQLAQINKEVTLASDSSLKSI